MPETNNGEVGGAYVHTNEGLLEMIRNAPPFSPGSSLNLDELFQSLHSIQREREATRLRELEARAMRFTRSWMDLQPYYSPEYRAYLESIMPTQNNTPNEEALQRATVEDLEAAIPENIPAPQRIPLPGRMANGDPIINTAGETTPQPPGYYVAYEELMRPPTPFGPNDPPAYFAGPPLRMTATERREIDRVRVERIEYPYNPTRMRPLTRSLVDEILDEQRGVIWGRVAEETKRIVNFKFHESGWTEVEKDHAPEMIEDRSCIFDTGMDNVPEAFIKEDLACIKKAQPKITIVLCAAANRVFFRSDIYWPDIIEQAYAKKHKLSEHPKAQVSVDSAAVSDSGVGQYGNEGQGNISGVGGFTEDGGQHETGRV